MANLVIAFEPAEAARVLPFLAPGGTLVTATTPIQPVTVALSGKSYRVDDVLAYVREQVSSIAHSGSCGRFVAVDEGAVLDQLGNRKALNTVLLASALATGCIPLTLEDLRSAIKTCVKPKFVELNLRAIDLIG